MAVAVCSVPCRFGVNSSSITHAEHCVCRAPQFTERLDYHCATLMVMFSLFVGIVRVFNITTARGQRTTTLLVFGALVAHVAYLNLVKFDYGAHVGSWSAPTSESLHWARHFVISSLTSVCNVCGCDCIQGGT